MKDAGPLHRESSPERPLKRLRGEASSSEANIDLTKYWFKERQKQQKETKCQFKIKEDLDLNEAHGPGGIAQIESSTHRYYDSQRQKYTLVNFRQQDQIEQQQDTIGHHHEPHDQAGTSIKEEDKQHLIGLLEKLINQRLGIKRFVEMLDQNKINNKEVLLFYRDYILKKYNDREYSHQLMDKHNTVLRYINELLMYDHKIRIYHNN